MGRYIEPSKPSHKLILCPCAYVLAPQRECANAKIPFIHIHALCMCECVCLRKASLLPLPLSLPPSLYVCSLLSFPLPLPLCASVVWALSQVECVFLNEYLMRLMRLAGGRSRVSGVERESEREEQEGGREREGGRKAGTVR